MNYLLFEQKLIFEKIKALYCELQTWSDSLAQRAQAWADELARTQSFDHGFLETYFFAQTQVSRRIY